ncbi:MAG: hypothetical protein DME75_11875 [Verrucomicrobia bacterium]|nr:MAG: hypothetical protein DME75_11875 [Verrucomicrobiota bacterium]
MPRTNRRRRARRASCPARVTDPGYNIARGIFWQPGFVRDLAVEIRNSFWDLLGIVRHGESVLWRRIRSF